MNPELGIALGSGSARGWAHIGILQALAEQGIKPGIISGSSIGALVGGACANGNLDDLGAWVKTLRWRDIVQFMDIALSGGGLIHGERLMSFFRQEFKDVQIDELPLPFGAVATNLYTGREVWLQQGSLLDSVRASFALPGLFTPIKLNDQWLVDGGLVNPVPVSLCRALGAKIVIAVNLNGDIPGRRFQARHQNKSPSNAEPVESISMEPRSMPYDWLASQLKSSKETASALIARALGANPEAPGYFEVTAQALNIMQNQVTRSRMAGDPPDVLLSPRLGHLGVMDYEHASEAIEEGRASVRRMLPTIEDALEVAR